MNKRLQTLRWSPLKSMLLPAALLLAIDGSTSGVQASGPAELLPDLPLAAVNAPNRINGLTVVEQDDGSTTIRLKGTRKPTFNVYRLSNPERLVVDVSGSERGAAVPHVPLDTWSVGRVTVDSVNEKGAKLARIVLNLKRESSYIVVPNDKDLVVTVTPREVPPEAYFARKSAGKRKAEIEGMRRDADAYKEAAEQQASTAEKRAKAAETKLAKLDTETQKRTRASEKKLGEAEQRVKEAQAKLRNVETARRMSARQRRKMESAKQELEAAKKDLQAQTSDLKKQLAVARKQKAKAEREAATARQRLDGELAAKRKEFDAEVAAMRSEGKREADALRAKAATEAAAQRKSAQAEAAALKKEAAAVKARSKREAAELRKQAATLRADGETQAAALRAKGAREAAALRKQGENEAAAARKLAERKLAAAETAMAAAKNERQQAAAARKEAEKALADAQKAKKRAKSKRKAELKRAVEQAQAAEKAARKRQHDAESQLGAISADRARLAKLLDEQSKKAAALEKSINSKNDELSTVEAKVRDARAKVDALGGAVTKSDVEQARSQAQRAAATATVLTKEVDRLRKNAAAARKRADDAEASLGKLKKRRSKARSKQLDEARKIATEERAKARAAAKRLGEREKKLAAVSNELAGKKAQAVALESKLDNLASKSDSLKRKNKSARKALGKAEADLAGVQGELERENQRLAQLQGKVKEAESKLDKTLAETKHHASVDGEWQKQRNAAGAARVKDVRFEDSRDESRIIIELDGPMEYAGSNITPRMKLLKLNGAAIPKQLERSLDASAYKGPVATVTSFREGDDVKVIVSTREDTKAELEEKPGQLIWKFPRKRAKGKPEVVSLAGSKVSGFASPPRPLATGSSFERRSKWRGERIDIELQDAPIKDVLLLFSDIGRVNIIAGQGVDGVVTMRLTHVPWDQALDIILKSLGLGMVQEGNVVRVATLQALEEERRKAIERANAQVQLKPLNTRLVPLSYASVGDMIPKVQSVLSSRGSVTPDTRTNTLIIMDVAENIALAEQLVGSLDAQTPQVLIEARIVEARTNWLRQLGIQWGFDYTASGGTGNPTGLLFPNSMGVAGGSGDANPDVRGLLLPPAALGNPNYAVDLPAPVGSGAGGALGFTFGSISGNLNTNLRLSAAEDEGEVRIISAPKIVTLNNNQAQIEQGVQIPISQVSAQGVNTRYVNATLALRVTPQVTNEGSVMLDVQVQKNEADFINTGARGDPTILTKQAQSQMLITDGDTAVIGGIYTRNQSVNRKKVPWLADIPVIGWFFKNKSEADTRTEVLIFLTPKIVNRAASIGG